jgi:hypothetical protein
MFNRKLDDIVIVRRFHVAYWNLIIGGIGILCILTSILNNLSTESIIEDAKLHTPVIINAGSGLLTSSFPLLLDVSVNLFSQDLFKSSNDILFGRICLTISTFLFGLLVTLQFDIFHLFTSYQASFRFMFWCHRIVMTCTSMFLISITDSTGECCNQAVVISILFCIGCYLHVSNSAFLFGLRDIGSMIFFSSFIIFYICHIRRNWST